MTAMTGQSATIDCFQTPLYTASETARYLDVPVSTVQSWAQAAPRGTPREQGERGAAVLTTLPRTGPRAPIVPFIGLAEGLVLTALRRSGVALQRIRPVLAHFDEYFGLTHALAHQRFLTDGAQVLYDFSAGERHARTARANAELVVLRDGQAVFSGVVQDYLRRLDVNSDGYPDLLRLPAYGGADVIVDPRRCFGQPIFAHGGARLDDALSLFCSGEPLDIVAAEYGLPREQLEGAVRIATRSAA